jgi:hypothetical protein
VVTRWPVSLGDRTFFGNNGSGKGAFSRQSSPDQKPFYSVSAQDLAIDISGTVA